MESTASAAVVSHAATVTFDPIVVNRSPLPVRHTLKIVSFNARGGDQFDAIIRCLSRPPLAGADVILLCEADWRMRRSGRREFAAEVASVFKMSCVYQPEFGVPRSEGAATSFLGNAILSAQPLSEIRPIPIPNLRLRRRLKRFIGGPVGVAATATFGGRRILIGVAHLNSRWNPAGRDYQMQQYLAELPREVPAIIGGDFNTTTLDLGTRTSVLNVAARMAMSPGRFRNPESYEPLFERLRDCGFEIRGANAPGKPTFTYSRIIPPFTRPKLDWIALRGLRAVPGSAAVVPARPSFLSVRVSDHDFVVCEARF